MDSRTPHVVASLLLLVAASAISPSAEAQPLPASAALSWSDPRLPAALRLVARLEAEAAGTVLDGLEATVDPLIRYRDYPHDGSDGAWTGTLGIDATIEFGEPADSHLRALQSLERARHEAETLELEAVTDALLAHADLLEAQQQAEESRAELAEAQEDLATVDAAELQTARLELRLAALEHREDLFELEEARRAALSFGLRGEAVYEPLRFALPAAAADPRDTFEYRMLLLLMQEAEAELVEARRAPLDDLRLRAAYRFDELEVDLEGGLINGRPAATLGLDLPGGVERWEFEVSAQLRVAYERPEIERLEEALDAARAELEAYPALFRAELSSALRRARLAEEGLDLAEEEFELTGDAGRLHRAWRAYLRAVAELLELTGEEWRARIGPEG
ncbi:MAG TPA: hypothetical protein VF168_06200 [Trueperaceae bacterium]